VDLLTPRFLTDGLELARAATLRAHAAAAAATASAADAIATADPATLVARAEAVGQAADELRSRVAVQATIARTIAEAPVVLGEEAPSLRVVYLYVPGADRVEIVVPQAMRAEDVVARARALQREIDADPAWRRQDAAARARELAGRLAGEPGCAAATDAAECVNLYASWVQGGWGQRELFNAVQDGAAAYGRRVLVRVEAAAEPGHQGSCAARAVVVPATWSGAFTAGVCHAAFQAALADQGPAADAERVADRLRAFLRRAGCGDMPVAESYFDAAHEALPRFAARRAA
jgi:hypothetical protein